MRTLRQVYLLQSMAPCWKLVLSCSLNNTAAASVTCKQDLNLIQTPLVLERPRSITLSLSLSRSHSLSPSISRGLVLPSLQHQHPGTISSGARQLPRIPTTRGIKSGGNYHRLTQRRGLRKGLTHPGPTAVVVCRSCMILWCRRCRGCSNWR